MTKRKLLTSVLFTASTSLLRFNPSIAGAYAHLADWVSGIIGGPKWLSEVCLAGLNTLIVFLALYKTPLGAWLDTQFELRLRQLFLIMGYVPPTYELHERSGDQYQSDFKICLKASTKIHCLLVTAYTLVYEEEKFILDYLKTLPVKSMKGKDFKVKLLSTSSPYWDQRARVLVAKRLDKEGIDVSAYKLKCTDGEKHLKKYFDASIEYYDQPPCWRLYIFDSKLFVSKYFGPPSDEFEEGHKTIVAAFEKGHPMYQWLNWEYRKLSPPRPSS